MGILSSNYATCRFCKRDGAIRVDGQYRLVKYGIRHWAHWHCLVERKGLAFAEAEVPEHQQQKAIREPQPEGGAATERPWADKIGDKAREATLKERVANALEQGDHYLELARDAQASGDLENAEGWLRALHNEVEAALDDLGCCAEYASGSGMHADECHTQAPDESDGEAQEPAHVR